MHESVSTLALGIAAAMSLTYVAVKVRQNKRRLRQMVGIVDTQHTFETQYLFRLVDSGQLNLYSAGVAPA